MTENIEVPERNVPPVYQLEGGPLYVALLAAWLAMLGSLYFSEIAKFVPCTLCWYQRILMYPLTFIIAVGMLKRDPYLPYYILPLSMLGGAISTYHYLLEKTHLFPEEGVCQAGVSCTTPWINWFGFVTIPFLALCAFLIITICTVIAISSSLPEGEEDEYPAPKARYVLGVVVVVFVFYGTLLTLTNSGILPMNPANWLPVG